MFGTWADQLYRIPAALIWLKNNHPKEKVIFASAATLLATKYGFPVRWSFKQGQRHRGIVMITKNQIIFRDSFFSPACLVTFIFPILSLILWVQTHYWLFLFGVVMGGIVVEEFLPYQLQIPARDIQNVKVESLSGIFGESSMLTVTTKSRIFSIASSQIVEESIVQKTFRSSK